MSSSDCGSCQNGQLRWTTRSAGGQPVDVYGCDVCGRVLAEEDWQVPRHLPRPGGCCNCGGARVGAVCTECGLSEAEDKQVHEELRRLIHPDADRLTAAQLAAQAGRRLIALKLASAAIAAGERVQLARLMRLDLLQELRLLEVAAKDCKTWVQDSKGLDPLAWSTQGEVLLALDRGSEAQECFLRSLALDEDQPLVRARLAAVLLDIRRFGVAREQALRVLLEHDVPLASPAARQARDVMGRYMRPLMAQGDDAAVTALLTELGEHVAEDASLSCARAWLDLRADQVKAAAQSLERARGLDPRCPMLPELDAALSARAPKKSLWWPWGAKA